MGKQTSIYLRKQIKKTAMLCIQLLIFSYNYSQEISIGQSLDNISVRNVMNYRNDELKFSDFKGKFIILDFWGFNCYSCLKSFPKLDSLQKQFNDQLQIILVNEHSKDATEQFFKKRKLLRKPSLPFITSDTTLNKLFPHSGVPFHVWIDSSGKVIYTANSFNLSASNIQKFINDVNLKLKKSARHIVYNTLFNDPWESSVQYYSYVAKCIDEGHFSLRGSQDAKRSITTYGCKSIVALYQIAYDLKYGIDNFERPGRTILITRDSTRYIKPRDHDKLQYWYDNNSYYYQLLLPKESGLKKHDIMLDDLNRFFNLKTGVEKRQIKCLTLVPTGNLKNLRSKGGKPLDNFRPYGLKDTVIAPVRAMINQPWRNFATTFQTIIENTFYLPFFSEVNYEGNIDISIIGTSLDSMTIGKLRIELKKYNLDLIEKDKMIDVLVIFANDKNFK